MTESNGLFLDAIGDIELHLLSSQMKKQQLQAIVNFFSVVKMLYPHHLLIQNNGLEMVAQETAPFIDVMDASNPIGIYKKMQNEPLAAELKSCLTNWLRQHFLPVSVEEKRIVGK